MLGNWSLGDYFKKEAILWSWEFLTSRKGLGLNPDRLAVSCFKGDKNAPRDEESGNIWKSAGVADDRIVFLGKKDNWWGPAGESGPCGPDTEMFYWKLNNVAPPKKFDHEDENWVEIWNDVFMQYNKTKEGSFEPLKKQSVDTGLGVERVTMILQGKETIFDTELFVPIFKKIENICGRKPNEENILSFRIISDHMRASTFILGDERGAVPSNIEQGYILRRFIRRSIRHGKLLGIEKEFCSNIAKKIIEMYKDEFPLLEKKKAFILDELKKEEQRFRKTLDKGINEFEKYNKSNKKEISGKEAFLLFQSYGFPLEMTMELAKEKGMRVDEKEFNKEFAKHQELSRAGAEKKFKSGLADNSSETTKLHTATHLLNEALRKVLGSDIRQRGSNITADRLRFDFNFDRKLTCEEKQAVENMVNDVINKDLTVEKMEMTVEEAKKLGAQAEFETKYGEKVSVYRIEDFSIEICTGPHVEHTGELGHFRIKKEESSAAGVRRIKGVLE